MVAKKGKGEGKTRFSVQCPQGFAGCTIKSVRFNLFFDGPGGLVKLFEGHKAVDYKFACRTAPGPSTPAGSRRTERKEAEHHVGAAGPLRLGQRPDEEALGRLERLGQAHGRRVDQPAPDAEQRPVRVQRRVLREGDERRRDGRLQEQALLRRERARDQRAVRARRERSEEPRDAAVPRFRRPRPEARPRRGGQRRRDERGGQRLLDPLPPRGALRQQARPRARRRRAPKK